ncbi:MAG: DnaJ (Hsp40), subfamily C, member 8 [Paramarteilia canceri]
MAHPDLNMTRESEATNAFDVIKKSASILKTDDGRNHCAEVIEQAKDEIKSMMEKERAILRKQRKPSRLLEDNEDRFFDAVKKRVTVLFADMARLKEEGMKKESKKAQIASQIAEEQKFVDEEEKEFKKLYECGRTDRIRSWKKFQTEGASKSKKFKHFVEKNTNKPIPQRVADSHKYT